MTYYNRKVRAYEFIKNDDGTTDFKIETDTGDTLIFTDVNRVEQDIGFGVGMPLDYALHFVFSKLVRLDEDTTIQ